MNIRVLVARILVVAIVFFGYCFYISNSLQWMLLWVPALWVISGILACVISKVKELNPFDFTQMIATVIVGCLGGFILLIVMATEHEDDKVSRTQR